MIVPDDVDFLVLFLSPFPDLNFASTSDDAYSHSREKVVGCVGVEVNTTVEHGSGVLSDTALDQGLASRVLIDEIGDIVNNTSNSD